MKLQKFLLILMSLMLVFTSTSFIALAEGEPEPVVTNECMIVETETEYATFAEAATAVEDGQTIKLFKDITLTSIPATTKKVTIDGDNHTITQATYFDINSLTIKNATYTTTAEFGIWAGTLTLENVTWNHNSGYGVTLCSGSANGVVLKDSTVISASAKELIYAKNSAGATITIENSTITGDWNIDNNGHGGVVTYTKSANITLNGNTVLNQNSEQGASGTNVTAFFFGTAHANLEIDSTVIFNVNSVANQENCSIVNGYRTAGVATVVDHGATYNINKDVVNAGFAYVSTAFDATNRNVNTNTIALCADGKVYNPNAKLPTDFTADVSLKAYTTSHITNSEAVADAEAETIRFPVAVDAEFYAAVKDSAKFGLEIVAGTLINAENGVDWATVEGLVKDQDSTDWDWAVEGEEYAALIENINTDALKATKFAVCGFVTVTYTDDTTATFYAEHSVELATSLA